MNLYKFFLVLFFIFLNFELVSFQLDKGTPESVGMSSKKLQSINNIFEDAILKKKFPGAVIAISRKGKLVYFESFGWQNYSKKIPMKKDSIFRIYSMTKPIVSIASMILHERGKLYLSEPVHKYLPEFRDLHVLKKIIKVLRY